MPDHDLLRSMRSPPKLPLGNQRGRNSVSRKGDLTSSPSFGSFDRRRSSVLFEVTPVNEIDATDVIHCDSIEGGMNAREVLKFLNDSGFSEDRKDPRLEGVFATLSQGRITLDEMTSLKRSHLVVQKALHAELAIPDFKQFTDIVSRIFHDIKSSISGGNLASYIPQLASVDPELWGLSICTVDGQRFSIGDSSKIFSVQSVSKPVSYAIALETNGLTRVHQHVGMEPSGRNFNERVLLPTGIPHNPLINTGAIMVASLLYKDKPRWERFENVVDYWRRLSGAELAPQIMNSTFLAERETANRNFCLAHMMAENPDGLFPSDSTTISTVLDDYFGYCSLGVTTDMMSVVAATLANGGVNPITDERVLSSNTVTACLSVMMTCGMYDASGEFSARNGFPAKSGVSGIIMAVIPGVCGICTYGPKIDSLGNSVKGLEFFSRLARESNIATPLYKSAIVPGLLTAFGNQFDWRTSGKESVLTKFTLREYSSLWWASWFGDELRIRQLAARGIDVNVTNYSGRSALNFAINSTNATSIIELIIDLGIDLHAPESDGGKASFESYIEDAQREGRVDILELLQARRESDPIAAESISRRSSSAMIGGPERIPVHRFFSGNLSSSPSIDGFGRLVKALDDCGLYYEPHMPSMDEPVFPMRELYVRALCGKLIIPNWMQFVGDLKACLGTDLDDDPSAVSPGKISLAVTSIDAQRIHFTRQDDGEIVRVLDRSGEAALAIDGIVRVILYELALSIVGSDKIHAFVGREPSGQSETSLRLNSDGLPYNPFTMAGCLTICHLLLKHKTIAEVIGLIQDRLGAVSIGCGSVHSWKYVEITKCVQNFLSSIDDSGDVMTSTQLTLELFYQAHAIRVDLQCLADYARALAKSRTDASALLSLMHSCGLDEHSGEWSFKFGMPARTSLGSGCVLVIIPGVLGYAVRAHQEHAPGTTVPAAVAKFQNKFVSRFNFHLFRRHFLSLECNDPTLFFGSNKFLLNTQFIAAAYNGDISTMKHILAEGLDVNSTDMDARTALHVAAGIGNITVCNWLLRKGANPDMRDQWGMTPDLAGEIAVSGPVSPVADGE